MHVPVLDGPPSVEGDRCSPPSVGEVVRRARERSRAVLAAVAVAVALLVTAAGLSLWLPDTAVARHWSLAWMGLDVATASAAATTALLLHRGDGRAALSATAAAALLFTDAWFDVATASSGVERWLAVVEAVFLEVPIALAATRLALGLVRPTAPADPPTPAPLLH